MKRFVHPLLVCAALALSGCATLNEAECVQGDWRGIGFADGAAGKSSDRFGRHVDACAKHGVRADGAEYLRGWERGIERVCTAPNGFREGARGAALGGVCPAGGTLGGANRLPAHRRSPVPIPQPSRRVISSFSP